METLFHEAFDQVRRLVDQFGRHEREFKDPSYQEAQVRQDFIDPFFVALGWDVRHEEQKNPYQQEVRVEKRVNDGAARRRADYAFYVRPNFQEAKFFVEAKKPARDLRNANDYFQTARYGWNAQASISALTDFEELHIIDCRSKPHVDSAIQLGIERFKYDQYADEETFRRVFHLFARPAVAEGAIEQYLADKRSASAARGIQRDLFGGGYRPLDESFLSYLDGLRKELAVSFKRRNPWMDGLHLTEAVQRTLDRLIFMRFLEDRWIEPDPTISPLLEKHGAIWGAFSQTCRRLGAKYNGVVFKEHFSDLSQACSGPEPQVFGSICAQLVSADNPFNFNYFPVHILGSIYERFLGNVVVANEAGARIEEKPLVRKSGGVFYTPHEITRRIVKDTVGQLIAGKSPKQIAKMRFLDPACGSGSFLIQAYEYLLSYHTAWYQEHPEQAKTDGCAFEDGQWTLSLRNKRDILQNCIFGVDVDAQAVEVAQMSLYLKLLEHETTSSANELQVLFKEKVLPNLSTNVVCGNSLIDFDMVANSAKATAEVERINPLDYRQAFPKVMDAGGFQAVIGNPPYVRIQTLREMAPIDVEL